jgi:hypothetical protein
MPCILWPLVFCSPLAVLLIFPRRTAPTGHCRTCGYDLQGNESGRCPECGTLVGGNLAPQMDAARSAMLPWLTWATAALTVAVALHASFRVVHVADVRAYYADPAYGNNAPWDIGRRYCTWAMDGPLSFCVASAILCVIAISARRSRRLKTGALPIVLWFVSVAFYIKLSITWFEWFFD